MPRFPEDFPITAKWPPRHPERLQLYSLPTPNGVKVSIMLEETGLPYEAHRVDFEARDQKSPEFLSLNPNGKIPAIIDPDGPDGRPMPLFESGVILVYLAEKTGQFVPGDEAAQYQIRQWVAFQVGGPGPMFGQVGFFNKFDGRHIEDKRPLERYVEESKRLLGVLEGQLERHAWIAGEAYSIADIATFPWVARHDWHKVDLNDFPAVKRWFDTIARRPAVARGMAVPTPPQP